MSAANSARVSVVVWTLSTISGSCSLIVSPVVWTIAPDWRTCSRTSLTIQVSSEKKPIATAKQAHLNTKHLQEGGTGKPSPFSRHGAGAAACGFAKPQAAGEPGTQRDAVMWLVWAPAHLCQSTCFITLATNASQPLIVRWQGSS